MTVVLALVIISTSICLAVSKAIHKHPKYLTKSDFELGEQLRKFQQTDSDMPLSPHLFEGDIAGIKDPKAYMEQLHAAMTQTETNGHANAIKSPMGKWPNATIPYVIDGKVNAATRAIVASAIKEIQEKTCVKIVPRTKDEHYLSIETGEGCNAFVGRTTSVRNSKQYLHLGTGCTHHSAVHELMHTIGFFHEHSRNDRDQYLTVNLSNVQNDLLSNMKVVRLDEATDLNTTFDFDSVMLYHNKALSKNGQPRIIPKHSIGNKTFGRAPGLSSNDVLKINLLYDCATNGHQSLMGYKAGSCADSNVLCPTWKADRQCERNSAWMKKNCKKTCGQC